MAKVLTGAEVDEILRECRANGEVSDYTEGPEQFFELPSQLGRGCWRKISLRSGLHLSVLNIQKRQTHQHKIQQHPKPMPLTLSYYLSGGCRVENDGLAMPEEEVAGRCYLYCLPDTGEVETYRGGDHTRNIRIQVSSEFMEDFSDRLHELPTDFRFAIEHPEKACLYTKSHITPAEQAILQQIWRWPYQGITRQLYLEAKVLELLALHVDQALSEPDPGLASISKSDLDRICEAQHILIRNMAYPPSLLELARQVHLNDRKLKEGFRQVFGTTVFGYLHSHRMQQARQLLIEGNMTVKDIAKDVGYASRSSFVAAFKKEFNVAPSRYLEEKRE